ncbi:hypothetical protein K2173_004086 [Erythroxylum novogranatense]|uniref:Uncharacterized protein n=1 Tax=Erythroxylum novogranatense TaxID=1862640 RepID=A0AAV8SK70_9ROSI|nr:hypothetical protein K2173_004086 [Erythroxylum novogranatense]
MDSLSKEESSRVLVLIFLLANFGVELISIVFGQLSSQHKHKALYLLLCLIMSIFAVLISISELVYKLIKEWDFRKGETNWRSWLHDPPPGTGVRVGFFPCITALTCAFVQSSITTVNYSLYLKDGNAPINVSSSPIIYAFGQLLIFLSFKGAKTETKPKLKPEPEPEPETEYHSVDIGIAEEEISEIQLGSDSPATFYSCSEAEPDDDEQIPICDFTYQCFDESMDETIHDCALRRPRKGQLWRKLKSKLKPKPGLWRKLKSKLKLKPKRD